jgi:predicted O-methyltransferase YrrM
VTVGGTAAYDGLVDVPDLVTQAVALARELQFEFSCRPEQGRLLQLLARGRRAALIGETGTGCGVGVAWLLSGVATQTKIVSVERDAQRAERASRLFAGHPNVTILHGDWSAILPHGPFELLVLDGGGSGKTDGDTAVDPNVALKPFGTVVIDDFTPPPDGHRSTTRNLITHDFIGSSIRLYSPLKSSCVQRCPPSSARAKADHIGRFNFDGPRLARLPAAR